LQKSEVEGCEYQDDSHIHRQPFPEVVLEEQKIYSDHNGYQEQYVKPDSRLASHFSPLFKYTIFTDLITAVEQSGGALSPRDIASQRSYARLRIHPSSTAWCFRR
jgi:hypothetical protein